MTSKKPQDIFQSLRKDAFMALEEAFDFETIRKIESDYFGKNGRLTRVLRGLKDIPELERKTMGSTANALKKEIEEMIKIKKGEIEKNNTLKNKDDWFDISRPGKKISRGHLHPISRVLKEVTAIFESMGFEIVEGPEAETEYYNFDALNIPKNHPARDMWDTFWLRQKSQISNFKSQKLLLRTHTSPMEARYMEKNNPPLRIIAPGRCFRHEATDALHEHTFYQVEGLMIGKKTCLANLKGILEIFLRKLFSAKGLATASASGGKDLKIRFRPSYYPFVEPGVDVDIKLDPKKDWLEIAGAGMTHPQVLKNVKLNPNQWQGFAFGLGLDRIAMLKYKINDIRLFHSGDLRFIKQF